MTNKFSATAILLLFVSSTVFSQEKISNEKKTKVFRPDIPGFFLIDFGFNAGLNKPQNFTQGFWGSRTVNLYYHYPIRISNSKFSYNPGVGFAFERFKLTNNYTLAHLPDGNNQYQLVQASGSVLPNASFSKSMLVTNYFDLMPLEFRFDSNPKDITRGFNISIGGRIGVLMESHTKIKYTDNGSKGIYKDKQSHGLNPFRYGFYSRVGLGNFNVFWHYNLSPYFATGRGPSTSGANGNGTTLNTMTIGVSINGL